MQHTSHEKAPDFCLPVINGGQRKITLSNYRNKAVLITFWVTWCPACQQELPQKEVFYRSLASQNVAFISINVTGREVEPDKVTHFLEKHRFTFPVLQDEGTKTYDAYGVTSVPTSVLIDPEGWIVNRYDETVPFVSVLAALGKFIND